MKQTSNPESEAFDFAEFLKEFGHGAPNTTATQRMREIVQACVATGRKGSITIKIDIAAHGGLAELRAAISCKKPEPQLPGSTYYTNETGELLNEDPRQLTLPTKVLDGDTGTPLRTVPFKQGD